MADKLLYFLAYAIPGYYLCESNNKYVRLAIGGIFGLIMCALTVIMIDYIVKFVAGLYLLAYAIPGFFIIKGKDCGSKLIGVVIFSAIMTTITVYLWWVSCIIIIIAGCFFAKEYKNDTIIVLAVILAVGTAITGIEMKKRDQRKHEDNYRVTSQRSEYRKEEPQQYREEYQKNEKKQEEPGEVKQKQDAAFDKLLAAAKNGGAEAQYKVGFCYLSGEGAERDYAEAVNWLRKAVHQSYNPARNCMAYCYEYGHGVSANKTEAFKLYKEAASNGDPKAQYNLACCYYFGIGVAQDKSAAQKWQNLAAEKGVNGDLSDTGRKL